MVVMQRLLTLSLVWLCACGRLSTDDGAASVTGRLLDGQGVPVVHARVLLMQARRPVAEVRSDADGRFVLHGPAGAAAIFALVDDVSDQGVYRGDLSLLPTGTTDVGELRTSVVWAWPEALWLRDTGFDEQLTRPGTDEYLGGGVLGEALITQRRGPQTLEVFRVEDDGTSAQLLDEPAVDPLSVTPMVGEPPPAVVNASVVHDAVGHAWVLVVNGGFTWVSAAGTVSVPFSRLRWLDPQTGAVARDEALAADETVTVLRDGVVVSSAARPRFVSHAGAVETLSQPVGETVFDWRGQRLGYGCDRPRVCHFFRLEAGGRVVNGSEFSLPDQGLINRMAGESLGVAVRSWDTETVTFYRADPDTLTVTPETVSVSRTALPLYPCSWQLQSLGWVERAEGLVHLVTLGSTLARRDLPTSVAGPLISASGCLLGDEWWLEEERGDGTRAWVRTQGEQLLEGVAAWRATQFLGTRPLLYWPDTEHGPWWLGAPGGDVSSLSPLARVPVVSPAGVTADPHVLIGRYEVREGQWALVRLHVPEGR